MMAALVLPLILLFSGEKFDDRFGGVGNAAL